MNDTELIDLFSKLCRTHDNIVLDYDKIYARCCYSSNYKLLELLFNYCESINYTINIGVFNNGPFRHACSNGYNMVKQLFEYCTIHNIHNINNIDIDIYRGLARDNACIYDDINLVKYLMEYNYNSQIYYESFIRACYGNSINTLNFLIQHSEKHNNKININNEPFGKCYAYILKCSTTVDYIKYLMKHNYGMIHTTNNEIIQQLCLWKHIKINFTRTTYIFNNNLFYNMYSQKFDSNEEFNDNKRHYDIIEYNYIFFFNM